jgi:hypothetical protein
MPAPTAEKLAAKRCTQYLGFMQRLRPNQKQGRPFEKLNSAHND